MFQNGFFQFFQLAMVVVIPLALRHRNTFLSYNMEANFYLQYFDPIQGIVPPLFSTVSEVSWTSGPAWKLFKFSTIFRSMSRILMQDRSYITHHNQMVINEN